MPLPKRILMSINESDITEGLTRGLQSEFANMYDLSITETPYAGKLLALAQEEAADLFLLLLNDMFCSDLPYFCERNRVESALSVISSLRQTYQKPVIAMTVHSGMFPENTAKEAGDSYYFVLPFRRDGLMDAVRQCLEKGAFA